MPHLKWWTPTKAICLYIGISALAIALTACSKGFEVDVKKDLIQPTKPIANVNASGFNGDFLLKLAAAHNENVVKLIALANSGPQQSDINVNANVGFALTELDLTGAPSAKDSVLTINIAVTAMGQTITTQVLSNQAEMKISSDHQLHIDGSWIVKNPNQETVTVHLNSVLQVLTYGSYNLYGKIFAVVPGTNTSIELTSFNTSVCKVMTNVNWLGEVYEEGVPYCGPADVQDEYNPYSNL